MTAPTIRMPVLGVHCQAIMDSRHLDVLEMDAASHNSVEDVRQINDAIRYAPVSARYKVYILDEVHMLSGAAFNALLKTLEEPPPHVKFIFATTEANKIPLTILSRCQRFDFGGISLPRIVERLKQIMTNMEEKPSGKKCAGMMGIIQEGDELLEEDFDGRVMDAALISAAQRAEHYEIAAYGSLRSWANRQGLERVAQIFERTLEEEKAADHKLTALAESSVNALAEEHMLHR